MKILFEKIIKHVEESWETSKHQEHEETKKDKLIDLSLEGMNGFSNYPDDKMFRWLGYLSGVLLYKEIPIKKEYIDFEKYKRNPLIGEKEAIIKIIDNFYYPVIKNNNEKIFLKCIAEEKNIIKSHYLLGVYQGYKIAKSDLNIIEERNRTRPILHSYRKEKIKSFG